MATKHKGAVGLAQVVKNLNKELGKIKGRTVGGLLAGALLVQRRSQERVPVEHGNLRASAFARKTPEDPMAVEVGYTAAYAPFVHENMEQKLKGQDRPSGLGKYWGPKGQPKFLETALDDSSREIIDIVKERAEVGK